jgi:hypothetical protein
MFYSTGPWNIVRHLTVLHSGRLLPFSQIQDKHEIACPGGGTNALAYFETTTENPFYFVDTGLGTSIETKSVESIKSRSDVAADITSFDLRRLEWTVSLIKIIFKTTVKRTDGSSH